MNSNLEGFRKEGILSQFTLNSAKSSSTAARELQRFVSSCVHHFTVPPISVFIITGNFVFNPCIFFWSKLDFVLVFLNWQITFFNG